MKLCSPTGHCLSTSVTAVERPRSLEGLRIGLLDNTKAPVDKMMVHLERRLRERIPGVQPFYISKRTMQHAAQPEVMQRLQRDADVVINALGD